MNESYSIEIPNEKSGTYQLIAWIIGMINFFAFAYVVFSRPGGFAANWLAGLGLALSLIGLTRFALNYLKKKLQRSLLEFFLIPCAIIWMISGAVIPGLLLMSFSILSFSTNKKKIIHFSPAGINYPSFPSKLFSWSEIDFVLLKDDILTIETKANRVLQFTLDQAVSNQVSAPDFNEFCTKCTTEKQP